MQEQGRGGGRRYKGVQRTVDKGREWECYATSIQIRTFVIQVISCINRTGSGYHHCRNKLREEREEGGARSEKSTREMRAETKARKGGWGEGHEKGRSGKGDGEMRMRARE